MGDSKQVPALTRALSCSLESSPGGLAGGFQGRENLRAQLRPAHAVELLRAAQEGGAISRELLFKPGHGPDPVFRVGLFEPGIDPHPVPGKGFHFQFGLAIEYTGGEGKDSKTIHRGRQPDPQ